MAEKSTPSETVYNLSQAAKERGISYTSVQNAKDRLAQAGAKVEGKGGEWVIPASALEVLPQPRAKKTVTASSTKGQGFEALHAEWENAEAEANILREQAQEAASRAKSLKKELDGLKRKAVKEAEKAYAEAQEHLSRVKELVGEEA